MANKQNNSNNDSNNELATTVTKVTAAHNAYKYIHICEKLKTNNNMIIV